MRIDEHGFAGARKQAEWQGVPDERIAGVVAARRDLLAELVAGDTVDRRPEVDDLLRRLARELVGERP